MIRKTARFLLGGIYVLLLGEAFVRIFAPEPIVPRYVQASDYGVRMNVPGARYWHFTPDDTTEYRINSAGFRADREYAVDKPDDTCRVVMLGDSFMVGYEVALEHTIPYLVERKLAAAGLDCEVINMGVSGFGTAEMLVELEAIGLEYEPDAVVFQWHFTDFDDNVRSGLYGLEGEKLETRASEYLPATEVRELLMRVPLYPWVIQHSQLYSALREIAAVRVKAMLNQLRGASGGASGGEPEAAGVTAERAQPKSPAEAPYDVRLAARLLHEAERVSNAHGARFYVLDVPRRMPDGIVAVSSLTRFSEFGLLDDLNVIEPEERLNRETSHGTKVYYENGHGHFNPLGYAIAADLAADAMIADLAGVRAKDSALVGGKATDSALVGGTGTRKRDTLPEGSLP